MLQSAPGVLCVAVQSNWNGILPHERKMTGGSDNFAGSGEYVVENVSTQVPESRKSIMARFLITFAIGLACFAFAGVRQAEASIQTIGVESEVGEQVDSWGGGSSEESEQVDDTLMPGGMSQPAMSQSNGPTGGWALSMANGDIPCPVANGRLLRIANKRCASGSYSRVFHPG